MTKKLLLEVLAEEIPSRFMLGTLKQIEEKSAALFKEERLPAGKIRALGTPRRLTLLVEKLAEKQEPAREKKKGPSCKAAFDGEGKPTKAALGFARSQGLAVEELVEENVGDMPYLFAVKEIPGQPTFAILPTLMKKLLTSLSFPKSMYWTKDKTRFPRPVRNILCLFGEDVVSFAFAGVSSGDCTYGHRFLAPGPWKVSSSENYLEVMEKGKVVVDHLKREKLIFDGIEDAAAALNGKAIIDQGLLQEVNFLVENPAVILGSFPEKYLELPREVPITAMQVHQKYFAVESKEGSLLPNFIAIANGKNRNMEKVKAGNEKVLRARLADARFFYEEDRRQTMAEFVDKLKTIVYHEGLGTMLEKTRRIMDLSQHIMYVTGLKGEKELVARAACLAKGDLVSQMVREFPELQGVMGKTYALQDGEGPEVAEAIYEHYLPKFSGDSLPVTNPGTLVALADKFDHLVSCFAAGIRPSGSQDPYALRRSGMGIIQILIGKKLVLPLTGVIEYLVDILNKQGVKIDSKEEIKRELVSFMEQRLRFYLQEKGFKYDIIDAALGSLADNFNDVYERCQLLSDFQGDSKLMDAAEAYQRVANLAAKKEDLTQVKEELFEDEAEVNLWKQAKEAQNDIEKTSKGEKVKLALFSLAGLKSAVDDYFDNVMVMTDNEEIRSNRLSLLKYVQHQFLFVADFNKLFSA